MDRLTHADKPHRRIRFDLAHWRATCRATATACAAAARGSARQCGARIRSMNAWQWAVAGLTAIGTGAGSLFFYVRYVPLPPGSLLDPTRVMAADGQILGDLAGTGVVRREVRLSEVPPALQKATLAVEDTSFYSHHGLNLKGIARALLADIGAGRVVQGGSTITQQLAKNLYLSGDRTLWRKWREAVYALQLESRLTKAQILTDYLNTIYYGDGAVGVGAAAEYYFGKPVSGLNLAQSTLLAGLPKGPSLYSPLEHPHAAKERQRAVLAAMVRAGDLAPAAAHAAFVEPLHFVHHQAQETLAPYFMEAVAKDAQTQLHLSQDDLYRGGLFVHTTLDETLQKALDAAIHRYIPAGSGLQAAAVALDPRTGDILAYSGGTDYRTSPYDRTAAMRQPGSAFKPFVYAAALDHGYTAALHMRSVPRIFSYDGGHLYQVHNFADDYAYMNIDMKQAIARSDNVFAVATGLAVGPKTVTREASLFGLPADMKPYPSLALGVFPVSVLDLARAYGVFATGGYLAKPRFITEVYDAAGRRQLTVNPVRVHVERASTSYILTDMMESVMKPGGTGYRVAHRIPGPVAAKTGTTDTDAWIAGYTPDTVCAVWVGYDRPRAIDSVQSHLAAPIFASVMRAAYSEHPQGHFTRPADVIQAAIDPETGQLATSACPVRETDYFVQGTAPTATCLQHPAPDATFTDRAWNALRALWGWVNGR